MNKLKKYFYSTLILFYGLPLLAQLPIYEKGAGAEYELSLKDSQVKVSIAIVESSSGKLVTEMHFKSPESFITLEMWQQFHMRRLPNSPMEVTDGYIYMSQIPEPQKLTPEYLMGYNNGAQLRDFLFTDEKQIQKYKIGTENVETKAGSTKATHYRIPSGGQTIDFWISESAKPIGLVKLISKGPEPDHNYTMGLSSLLKGVERKIDPTKTIPLNALGKSFLPKVGPNVFLK